MEAGRCSAERFIRGATRQGRGDRDVAQKSPSLGRKASRFRPPRTNGVPRTATPGRPGSGEGARGTAARCRVNPAQLAQCQRLAGPCEPSDCSVFLLETSGAVPRRAPQGDEEQEAPLHSPRRVAPICPGADDSPARDGPGHAATPLCPPCVDAMGTRHGGSCRLRRPPHPREHGARPPGASEAPRALQGQVLSPTLCGTAQQERASRARRRGGRGRSPEEQQSPDRQKKQVASPHGCLGGNRTPQCLRKPTCRTNPHT